MAFSSIADPAIPRTGARAEAALSAHEDRVRDVFRRHALEHAGNHGGAEGRAPSRWQRWLFRAAREELAAATPATVLDAGCGNGAFLADGIAGAEVTGCDLVAEAVRLAPVRARVAADVRALPFADRAFDAVACLGVLSLVPRDGQERAIGELARVAKRTIVTGVHDGGSAYFRWIHPGVVEGMELAPLDVGFVRGALEARGFALMRVRRVFLLPILSPLALLRFERR